MSSRYFNLFCQIFSSQGKFRQRRCKFIFAIFSFCKFCISSGNDCNNLRSSMQVLRSSLASFSSRRIRSPSFFAMIAFLMAESLSFNSYKACCNCSFVSGTGFVSICSKLIEIPLISRLVSSSKEKEFSSELNASSLVMLKSEPSISWRSCPLRILSHVRTTQVIQQLDFESKSAENFRHLVVIPMRKFAFQGLFIGF